MAGDVEVVVDITTTDQRSGSCAVPSHADALARADRAAATLEQIVEQLPIGVGIVGPDGRWMRVNAALCTVLAREEEVLLGADPRDGLVDVDLEAVIDGGPREVRVWRPDGQTTLVSLSVARTEWPDRDGPHFICMIQDVTAQRHRERSLQRQVDRDELTGVSSRRHILGVARVALERWDEAPVVLLYVDLDRFKHINDAHGHNVGDEVLRKVGRRLRRSVGERGVVGRLGGDEFLVVAPSLTREQSVRRLVGDIRQAVAAPIVVDDLRLAVRASIGSLLVRPQDGVSLVDALRAVDQAMYAEKRASGRRASDRAPRRSDGPHGDR